jgi:TetR/AcrR family transcriptional regulator, transcriptional repressor for nem operon
MARPREFDETVVVAAARERFRETGYAATSLDDLTKATGLGKGSLYGAFGDKRHLFQRAFDDYCATAAVAIAEALRGPDDGALARLQAYATGVADDSSARDRRGCLLANTTVELAGRDAEAAAVALSTYEALEDEIAACVEQARRHGDVPGQADPRHLAAVFTATLRGVEVLGKAGMSRRKLRTIADAAVHALTVG